MKYKLPLSQLAEQVAAHPDAPYLHQPVNREWHTLSWAQVDNQARRIANGLLSQGLIPGDRVAILAKNSAEWLISDFAIMMAGLVSVPIYSTAGQDTIEHVLQHSGAKVIFTGKLDNTEAADAVLAKLDIPVVSYPYPGVADNGKQQHWQQWLSEYAPLAEVHSATADELMTLVYTSGSTGTPKGVVLSYLNLASASNETAQLMPPNKSPRVMSYLPLAHITERSVVGLTSLYTGSEVFFVESLDTFIDDVRHAQPTTFLSVPRLWTKFQSQILSRMNDAKLQRLLKIPIVGKLVAKKIRKGLGLDQCQRFASGSAPIPADTLRWYERIGIEICEGWGMTETCGLSCGNLPFNKGRIGTIGLPQPCVEMMLSDQSEILIRGDAVFKEYYKSPEATTDAFTNDWFHTGDKAKITSDGAWQIVGRIKEQFKTSKGKFVTPVPIEGLLQGNSNVEQACVFGSGRKQPIAVIVLSENITTKSQAIVDELQLLLEQTNQQLEGHQHLDHLLVAETPWSIENGLLTPTLKIKRDKIWEKFDQFTHKVLPDTVVWESDI